MPALRCDNTLWLHKMSEKKSPPNKERTVLVKGPLPGDTKGMKRKFLITEPNLEEEDRRVTPKRKKSSLTSESSPDPANNIGQPRTPQASRNTVPLSVPLSERQQLAMLMKMTDETQGDASPKPSSPTTPMSAAKRTPIDKKVNKRNDRGETALHGAAKRGDVKETKRLIKAGADVNVTDYAGWTPLHEACNRGMLSVAKQLVKAGAYVKVEGLDNDTPLHDAAINGHHKLVLLLLKHGANPHQANANGKTPIDVAASGEIEQILRRELHMSLSNSDSSSIDDARSPMSPESTSSFKDEDRPLESDHLDDYTVRSGSIGSSSRRALIPKSPDKTGSPRLLIKFQPIKPNTLLSEFDIPQKSKDTKEPQFQSYSVVTVNAGGQKENFSATGSPVSSVDSDMYDANFRNITVQKVADVNKEFSVNPVFETCSDKNGSSIIKERPFSELGSGTQSFSPRVYDEYSEGEDDRLQPVSTINTRELWDNSHIPHTERNNFPTSVTGVMATSCASLTTDSLKTLTNHHVTVSLNSGWSGLNSQKKEFVDSSENSNLDKSELENQWEITLLPKDDDSVQFSEENSQSSIVRPFGESDDIDDRPSSPKVPPLKIIIPPKTAEKEKVSLKVTLKPGGLPYVYKPSPEEQLLSEQPNSAPVESLRTSSPTLRPITSSSAPPVTSSTSDINEKSDNKSSETKDTNKMEASPPEVSTAKVKEETPPVEERRVTRKLRSHTAQLQQQKENNQQQQPSSAMSSSKQADKNSSDTAAESGSNSTNHKTEEIEDQSSSHMHPRKRKLRPKPAEPVEAQVVSEPVLPPNPAHWYQMPPNPFELFLGIRRQISSRRKNFTPVTPKPPQGYKDYLMVNCTYVLQGNTASKLSVPMLSCPHSVEGPMKDFFIEQENARYKLRLQHLIEREKLVLSVEQEVLREHGRAARADMNQSVPLSACTVLREEEVYNFLHSDQPEECEKNVRARYNKRQFISWLQDVSDKYEKIKKFLLYRHRHEAESLNAVQKLDWECKLKDLGLCDHNVTPVIEELHLPMVTVSDEFDLLPV